MLGKRRWLSLFLVAAVATFGMGLSAGADSATEGQFLAKINASRASSGLAPLSVDGGLRSHARNHTQDMMDADAIFHSTSSELSAAAGSGWSALAENVGRGSTVDSLHSAFMNSSGHKKNILGDYNYVGIGTGTKDGRLYVTVVFMRKGSTSSPTTTTTTPAPTTTKADETSPTTKAPEPGPTTTKAKPKDNATSTTTTTTIPPTTTTTMDVPPDKAVTPGQSCVEATRFWQLCHD